MGKDSTYIFQINNLDKIMEKLVTNELIKYIIILGAGGLAITAVMARLITKFKGSFKPYSKSTIIYLVVFVFFFAVIGVSALPVFFDNTLTAFVFLQVYFLLLGCCHVYFIEKKLTWTGEEKSLLPEILFTILVAVFGCIAYMLIYNWLNKNGFAGILATSIILFVIPFFFYQAFNRAMQIPLKVVKQWFYPVNEEMEEPEDSKMKNLVVISFEFQKQDSDNQVTNFRAKAPRDMEFGQLFYFFINDYNAIHTNSEIQFTNSSGESQGWIFYKKPKWHSLVTKYIDSEKTIFTNNIVENDVIICSRSQT